MENFQQAEKKNITLNIGSISLPLVISINDEEVLVEAANLIDEQINQRRKTSIVKPLDVTAIMVALSTASELLKAEKIIANGIQEQLSPHLDMLRQELSQMHNYADEVMYKLEII